MKLSLKQKALLQTLGMLVTCVVAGTSVVLAMKFFSVDSLLTILGITVMSWLVYLMYSINLNQLQYREKLKEMVDK